MVIFRLFRRVLALATLALIVLVVLDVARPPERQQTAAVAVGAIGVYRRLVSPRLEALGLACRFDPTCSRYAETVIRRQGLVKGSWLALARIARCGPWTPAGTVDPAP